MPKIHRREGEHTLYWKFRILSLNSRLALKHTRIATPQIRTITGFELVITRCWDGFAVHMRTVGRFEIDHKRPIRLSVRTDSEGKG
jgi:hypothetical protein